jgi:hypothetical protein
MTDYAQKAIDAIHDVPHDARRVYLWEFPDCDFAAYQAMPDVPQLKSYSDYLAVLAAMQADLEQQGTRVIRVRFPVATMLAELEGHGWPNDVPHRTRVTGELGARQDGENGEIGR